MGPGVLSAQPWVGDEMQDRSEFYRSKLEEAERNAATAREEKEKENWLNIAAGYRILSGEVPAVDARRKNSLH